MDGDECEIELGRRRRYRHACLHRASYQALIHIGRKGFQRRVIGKTARLPHAGGTSPHHAQCRARCELRDTIQQRTQYLCLGDAVIDTLHRCIQQIGRVRFACCFRFRGHRSCLGGCLIRCFGNRLQRRSDGFQHLSRDLSAQTTKARFKDGIHGLRDGAFHYLGQFGDIGELCHECAIMRFLSYRVNQEACLDRREHFIPPPLFLAYHRARDRK